MNIVTKLTEHTTSFSFFCLTSKTGQSIPSACSSATQPQGKKSPK
jgi:hypothetical protein